MKKSIIYVYLFKISNISATVRIIRMVANLTWMNVSLKSKPLVRLNPLAISLTFNLSIGVKKYIVKPNRIEKLDCTVQFDPICHLF